MPRRLWGMAVVGLVMAWAGMAHACEGPKPPLFWYDEPITIAADGSFTNGGEIFGFDLVGRPVVDIGDGKIGQRLRREGLCRIQEQLLVVDCNTTEIIVVDGRVDPDHSLDLGMGRSTTIDMLYPPYGKIRLTRAITVSDLVQIARSEGYEFETDLLVAFGGGKKKNRYDPFYGCEIFYPDSAGAAP
ncbi:MAG: hypothetical protein NTX73_05075 [Rhodobacterales bacterium]|nr:hypothetical protein [Rhodobacterales bacterium]